MLSVEDRLGQMTAYRDIVRKINSRARLGELVVWEGVTRMEGRMIGLLRPEGRAQ